MSIDLDRITHPLRLARGSHQPGSGKGCAMNVISYINGDVLITDYPSCSARPLAIMVQNINDTLAGDDGFLSPEDSITVLDLGWATVGTGDTPWQIGLRWMAQLLRKETRIGRREYAAYLLERGASEMGISPETWERVRGYIAFDHYDNLKLAIDSLRLGVDGLTNAAGFLLNAHAFGDQPLPNGKRVAPVEWVRDAIQLWRDMAGLDDVAAIKESDINNALTQIGV
jgi:hypothetical protein